MYQLIDVLQKKFVTKYLGVHGQILGTAIEWSEKNDVVDLYQQRLLNNILNSTNESNAKGM